MKEAEKKWLRIERHYFRLLLAIHKELEAVQSLETWDVGRNNAEIFKRIMGNDKTIQELEKNSRFPPGFAEEVELFEKIWKEGMGT